MEEFAKLFNTEEHGQILVKIDASDDDSDYVEVRFYFKPKGLGICSLSLNFTDDDCDTNWDKAERAFNGLTEEMAIKVISQTKSSIENKI